MWLLLQQQRSGGSWLALQSYMSQQSVHYVLESAIIIHWVKSSACLNQCTVSGALLILASLTPSVFSSKRNISPNTTAVGACSELSSGPRWVFVGDPLLQLSVCYCSIQYTVHLTYPPLMLNQKVYYFKSINYCKHSSGVFSAALL